MSKELTEFKIALNKLVDDDNMPEVLDLINSEILRLLDRLKNNLSPNPYIAQDGTLPGSLTTQALAYGAAMLDVYLVIRKEIKQYESKKPKGL